MRILLSLLLVTAATATITLGPTASACHVIAVDPDDAFSSSAPGYYLVPGIDYGGCPHKLTVCTQVWRESNGQPGLQTTGSNPDMLIVLVCPYP